MSLKDRPGPWRWTPPTRWCRILTVDAHTGGEPLHVVFGGFPELPGETMLARQRQARQMIESILGARVAARIAGQATVAGRPAVVPAAEGRIRITGHHELLLDPDDPLRHGFLVR